MKTVIVTTGDIDGIGFEVFSKALLSTQAHHKCPIVFYVTSSQLASGYFNSLKPLAIKINQLQLMPNQGLYFIESSSNPVSWVYEAAEFCTHFNEQCILVTGPLDKNTIANHSPGVLGHTEILAQVTKIPKSDLLMFFMGKYFNILCLTGHIPVSEIHKNLTSEALQRKFLVFDRWLEKFEFKNDVNPIACLGLNPHSSDKGLIGQFEETILLPLILKHDFISLKTALVPDSAFVNFQDGLKFRTALAMYHDQGLIPFKIAHGFSGVHLTVGLPFLRISVDHGTAKNLFGQNSAHYESMNDCLELASKQSIK
jgi:4-hydroxythreonine-4-phosphate dehydrogenase